MSSSVVRLTARAATKGLRRLHPLTRPRFSGAGGFFCQSAPLIAQKLLGGVSRRRDSDLQAKKPVPQPLRHYPHMTEPTPTPSVVVIGSLNVDTLLNVPWFPEVGATVAATGFERRYGGKGANQALAAARQGATASLIGCVGDDGKGPAYMDYLESSGLNIQGVNNLADVETGAAYISVYRVVWK